MPPNTPSNPIHPPITPVTPVQQSIRNFFRPDLNQLVANVFDLPPSPSVPPAHSPSPAGATAIHENRKRDRDDNDSSGSADDSIFGLDTVPSPMSASLIANTSIARRIRLSSETLPPLENTSTPVTLSQQMHDIRQSATDNNVDTTNVNQVVMADAHDRSSHSNTLNILHMVDGINVITRQVANVVEHRQAFEWDDTGMAPTLPHISPRPLPNIPDDGILNVVPSEGTTRATSSQESQVVEIEVEVDSNILNLVRDQMNDAASRIESIINGRLSTISNRVEDNTSQIENIRAWIEVIEEGNESQQRTMQTIDERVDFLQDRVNEGHTLFNDNRGHINRIDQSIAGVIRNQASHHEPDSEMMRLLIQRIESLENANHLSQQELDRFRKNQSREDDEYYLRTISIKGFAPPPNGTNHRRYARNILATIECEDVMTTIARYGFSDDRKSLRITFKTIREVHDASHWFAQGIKGIRDRGGNPALRFNILTPPRFSAERKLLNNLGNDLKRQGSITRFSFILKGDKLWLKTYKAGEPDRLIAANQTTDEDPHHNDTAAPTQQQDQMDTTEDSASCPICMNAFDEQKKTVAYACGHLLHEICLATALDRSLKCPVCRIIPPCIDETSANNCDQCTDYVSRDIADGTFNVSMLVLTGKCHHIHHEFCHASYLADRDLMLPINSETLEYIRENTQFAGCHTCQAGLHDVDRKDDLMFEVRFSDSLPSFLDMDQPYQRPRANYDHPIPLYQLIPMLPTPVSASGSQPAASDPQQSSSGSQSIHPAPLSGSNAVPLHHTRQTMGSSRSPTPTRSERRERSPNRIRGDRSRNNRRTR